MTATLPPDRLLAQRAGPAVLSSAVWPETAADLEPPRLAGFVASSFSPLVVEVAERCLRRHFGEAPVEPAIGERTAVVIVSVTGDVAIESAIASTVDGGDRMAPLLFFQSVPNTAAGRVAARWGLAGPVICISPPGDLDPDPEHDHGFGGAGSAGSAAAGAAIEYADELIGDGDADRVLLVLVEQGETDEQDRATALLVAPTDERSGGRS